MTENDNVVQFPVDKESEEMGNAIESIMAMDDEALKVALEGGHIANIVDSIYDELAITKQIEEFKARGFSRNSIAQQIENLRIEVDALIDLAGGENEIKRQAIAAIMGPSVDFLTEVWRRYENADAKIYIELFKDNARIPTRMNDGDWGFDVYAIAQTMILAHETKIIPLGIKVVIPRGWALSVRPRSGMSAKTSLRIANAPGTLDSGYRGEVGVIIDNTSDEAVEIKKGDRIGQLVLERAYIPEFVQVDSIDNVPADVPSRTNPKTDESGFGSTGR